MESHPNDARPDDKSQSRVKADLNFFFELFFLRGMTDKLCAFEAAGIMPNFFGVLF